METKTYEVNISTKQAQQNVNELNKSLDAQVDLIDDITKEIDKYENELKGLNDASSKTLKRKTKLNQELKKAKTRLSEEKDGLKKVTKERNQANKTLKTATENQADYSGALSMADGQMGGIIGSITNLTKTVGAATKGFNFMKIAIIGTGIGALIIAITAVGAAFKGSEEGQNKFAKIMGVIGAITGNLVDLLADLGDAIISAFENPKEAINGFVKTLKENIINRFEGMLELIPQIGKAIGLLFSGEFSEAGKVAANAVGKVALGVENVTDKVATAIEKSKEFVQQNLEEGKAAAKVADMRARADKVERGLLVRRANAEREVAKLRLIAKDMVNKTAEERKAALEKVLKIQDSLIGSEQEIANLRRDAQTMENSFARSTKENLETEEQLKAEAIAVETRRLNQKRQIARELSAAEMQILREAEAEKKRIAAEQKTIDDAKIAKLKKLEELKKQIRDASAFTEEEQRQLKITKTEEHYAKLISLAEKQGLDTVALISARDAKIVALNTDTGDTNADLADKEAAAKLAAYNSVGAGIQALATLAGEETAAGKALAIASATISTFTGIASIWGNPADTTLPTPLAIAAKIAGTVAVAAGGFGAVKKIISTKVPKARSTGGSAPSMPAAPPIPPAFNIVGSSDTNQLADAIGTQSQVPTKAYVVANDVTTAQSLERNIVEGASIG